MEEAVEIPKTPEAREWICLGSDLEILEAKVVNTRELVSDVLTYSWTISIPDRYR